MRFCSCAVGIFTPGFFHSWDGSYIKVRYSVVLRKLITPLATAAMSLGGGASRSALLTVRYPNLFMWASRSRLAWLLAAHSKKMCSNVSFDCLHSLQVGSVSLTQIREVGRSRCCSLSLVYATSSRGFVLYMTVCLRTFVWRRLYVAPLPVAFCAHSSCHLPCIMLFTTV